MSDILSADKFQRSILKLGLNYSEDQITYLFGVLKDCAMRSGVPMAGAAAAMSAGAGSIVVPGVGAVPGWVLGALAGFATGTAACTVTRMAMKSELDKLLVRQ